VNLVVGRAEVEARLADWAAGRLDAPALKTWVSSVTSSDPAAREVLAELDLLEVSLLTPEDVPALRALLAADDVRAAARAFDEHKAAIDLDARSRRLKRNPFYRPFCR
jgi:hypothetical protein